MNPIGYIQTPSGSKPIYPMNDIFLGYTFNKPKNWDILRDIINIITAAFQQINPATTLPLITGPITVKTKFKHFLNPRSNPQEQDTQVTENNANHRYIEFQNDPLPDLPIEIRSITYFGIGISKAKGHPADQIWLIAGDVPGLLDGQTFARYTLTQEITHKQHPNTSGILYVNLQKLSEESTTAAGQLALHLTGKDIPSPLPEVETLLKNITHSFDEFKEDEEIKDMMNFYERMQHEARAKGKAEGIVEGEAKGELNILQKLTKLIDEGLASPDLLQQLSNN